MNSETNAKLDDFILWAGLAFDHYFAARHSDSLTNTRKAGEACCKVLLYSKIKDLKRVEDLIKYKSYKDLINAIIENSAAPRKAINWLETLQIYGNLATHDNKVGSIESEYGYNALKLLTEWLFNEELSIKIPPRLIKHIRPKIHEDELKKRIESLNLELNQSNKQSKKLKEEILSIEEENVKSGQTEIELKKELEEERKRANELENSIERIKALEEKLNLTIEQANVQKEVSLTSSSEAPFPKDIAPEIFPKKRNWKKITVFSIIGFGVFALFLFKFFFLNNPPLDNNTKELSSNDSVIRVLVLPLSIMQDNPYISFKIEEAIIDELKIQTKDQNIDVEIFFDPGKDLPAKSITEAFNSGKSYNCNMVYYGEIFEQAGGDSVNVNIKYLFIDSGTFSGNEIKGELETKSFSNLTDKNFQKIKNEIGTIVAVTKISKLYKQKKWDDVLSIIYKLKPRLWSLTSKYNLGMYETGCYRNLRQFEKMLTSGENTYKVYPDSAFAKIELALIYAHDSIRRYVDSKNLTEGALKEYPDYPKFKVHYALLLCKHFKDTLKAKSLLEEVIKKNPEYFAAWVNLGDLWIDYYKKNEKAFEYYNEALKFDSNNVYVLSQISRIYFQENSDPVKAELYLNRLLKLDNKNVMALCLLANFEFNRKNFQTAIQYSETAEKILQKNPNPVYYKIINPIIGLSKYYLGDPNGAFLFLEKSVIADSTQPLVNTILSQLYSNKNKTTEALNLLKANYKYNYSLITCYNIGAFLLSDKLVQNQLLGLPYMEKALKFEPNDSLTLNDLSNYYFIKNDYVNAGKYFRKLLSIYPQSYQYNYYSGACAIETQKIKEARKFLENCIKINPHQPEAYAELARALTGEPNFDFEKTIGLAQKSTELNPNFSVGYFRLAQTYNMVGMHEKSREMFEKAKKIDPNLKNNPFEEVLIKLGY